MTYEFVNIKIFIKIKKFLKKTQILNSLKIIKNGFFFKINNKKCYLFFDKNIFIPKITENMLIANYFISSNRKSWKIYFCSNFLIKKSIANAGIWADNLEFYINNE